MSKNKKIVLTGGGSVNWTPHILNDLLMTPGLESAHFVIHDIDEKAAGQTLKLAGVLNEQRGQTCTFEIISDHKEAYKDADFVIITISTGGLDAMEHDIKIPEEYGIYATVGDTVGPGGWSRAWRNIPVFKALAKSIKEYSNDAVVLNYTNPMSVLTKVFYETTDLRTVGLCHGLFEVYKTLMSIFSLKSEDEIKVRFGGTNHFFWITELSINGQNGYKMIKEKAAGRSFYELILENYKDNAGFTSNKLVTSELYDTFGYLPYVGDRHICEFLSCYLKGDESKLKAYQLSRTTIEERWDVKNKNKAKQQEYIKGEKQLPDVRTRETAADIIGAIVNGSEFIDVVNLPNTGQIPNLPAGSIVETLGLVNSLGFTPICCGSLPEPVLNLVLPHVKNQDLLTKAGLILDFEAAIFALYNDPLCAHLSYPKIYEMGKRLVEANKKYMEGWI